MRCGGTVAWAILIGSALCAGLPASAQTLAPGAPAVGPAAGPAEAAPLPAATYDPSRLRTQLLSLHGFTREQLDAASMDVPEILMAWIENTGESAFIRRQAIKALPLYPTDTVFAFIGAHLPQASTDQQQLYLSALKVYAPSRPQDVQQIVLPLLSSPQVVVRQAAVEVAGRLTGSGVVVVRLQERLAVEPDPGVRKAIERTLAP
jgi:hypothetical protein